MYSESSVCGYPPTAGFGQLRPSYLKKPWSFERQVHSQTCRTTYFGWSDGPAVLGSTLGGLQTWATGCSAVNCAERQKGNPISPLLWSVAGETRLCYPR